MKFIKRILYFFRNKKMYVSNRWLIEHNQQESEEGWEGPRWRFPAEITELNRLERKRKISIARRTEREQRRA